MNKTLRIFSLLLLLIICVQQNSQVTAAGCVDDESCTDLCGFAGAGECVDGKYCKCENCPGRSIYELTRLPKICTLDPTCICPSPIRLSLTNGRLYTGHRCLHGTSLVCICYCLPLTPSAIIDVVKCPFPKNNGTTNGTSTTTTPASTSTAATSE